ncbi:MAG TPA: pyridoxal phosphate-dependent aminotransferase [Ignavibacteriaceae bacterium]|nr:pyridoxal phosphate-dependent aminotransferase [Ignavibacteriaceae bacterium]
MVADRVNEIAVSETMVISAEAKKLKTEGVDVINLSMGEPDFHTPNNIKEAGKTGIDENHTRYTINSGTVELRTAIQAKLKRENHLEYKLNEIIVSNGAKQSCYNAILATVNPGDEVIIPAPYWVSYPAMVNLAQGKAIIIDTDESTGFRITPQQLNKAITPKTKMLILCNPSNPTGSAYNKKQLEELAEATEAADFYILADEIYEKVVYDDFIFFSFAQAAPKLRNRIILVNGISKSYAMTGWRIGYTAANESVIEGMNKIQSHSTSHASSISQVAAIEALTGPQYVINEMFVEFRKRREFLHNELTSIKGVSCYKPEGAFYLFPNISAYLKKHSEILKIETSFDFAMHLLYEAHIAVVPGNAFGAEGYIRMSYATSMENLKEAVIRLKKALAKLVL